MMDISWVISFAAILVVLLAGFYLVSRFRTAKLDEALIVTGAKVKNGMKIIKNGGVFIWPIIQRVDSLSLQLQSLEVSTPEVFTEDGIPVMVEGIAQFKVGNDLESISIAAEHFLGKKPETVMKVVEHLFQGYLRTILAQLTMDSIYKQRDDFAGKVKEFVESDMKKMGLQVVSFTIKDIKDNSGYMDTIGLPQIASLKRDAEIAKAIALRDEQVAKSKALEERQKAEFNAETSIAEAAKEMEVKKTNYMLESEQRKAEAEQAMRLMEIQMTHKLKEEEMNTQLMEKKMLNELEAKELERRENHTASLRRSGINIEEEMRKEIEMSKDTSESGNKKRHSD